MGMIYHEGEKLRLTIEAYRPPSIDSIPQFGSAKITIPNDGYTYNSNDEVKMKTVGGNATFVPYPEDVVTPPPSRNKGRHVIHFGGKYKSFLLVPEIPTKK